jgi:signal transduction histidine kinase
MRFRFLNWKGLFFLLALGIVGATLFYTQYLSKKIEAEERQRVAEWIAAASVIQGSTDPVAIGLANLVNQHNEDMPLIATDSKGNIIDYHNIDSAQMAADPKYLDEQLILIKGENEPLTWDIETTPPETYLVYYGNTLLQREVRYYPLVQLLLVALFVALLMALITTQNRSSQNQVWAGMAKETAHQLGTPLTSLQGWLEVLREEQPQSDLVGEMEKDVNRLKLVSERFGKIGSTPQLEPCDIVALTKTMITYMKRRASEKVVFNFQTSADEITLSLSSTLLEWVLENLLKNALDAMDGNGKIGVQIKDELTQVIIDISDTGKGISSGNLSKVFQPGFSTKKRGWGLGLTLCKRIVEQYHKGQLFVKQSEPGKGTTFRMILPR